MATPDGVLTPIKDEEKPVGNLTPIEDPDGPVGTLTPIETVPERWEGPTSPGLWQRTKDWFKSDPLEKLADSFMSPEWLAKREAIRADPNSKKNLGQVLDELIIKNEASKAQVNQKKADFVTKAVSAPFSPLKDSVSPTTRDIAAGLAQATGDTVAGLTSPESVELIGGLATPLAPAFLLKEVPKMAYGTVKSGVNTVQNWDTAGTQQNTANIANTVVSALATLGMGKALRPKPGTPSVPPPVEPPVPKIAPEVPAFRGKIILDPPKPEVPMSRSAIQDAEIAYQNRTSPPVEITEGAIPDGLPTLFDSTGRGLFKQGENQFVRAASEVPKEIRLPNEPVSPMSEPITLPEQFGKPRSVSKLSEETARLDAELANFTKMMQDQTMQKALPSPGQTANTPAIPLPASLEGAKVADQFTAATQPPSGQPLLPAAGQTAIPLPPPGGLPPMELPRTLNKDVFQGRQAIVRPENMSTVDLIKDAFGGVSLGAVGKNLKGLRETMPESFRLKNERASAAQAELLRRATDIAAQTGEDVEKVFSRLLVDPTYRQTNQNQGGLVDSSGQPLQRLPEQIELPNRQAAKISETPPIETTPNITESIKVQDLPNYDLLPDGQKIRRWGRQDIKFKEGQMEGARGVKNALIAKSSEVLRRSGPAGKMFADLVDQASFEGMRQGGEWVAPYLKTIEKLSDAEFKKVIDVLENKEGVRASSKEFAAANELRNLLEDAGNKAEVAIPDFKKVENYFPQKGNAAFKKLLKSESGINWYEVWLKKNFPELKKGEIDEIIQTVRANEDLGKFVRYVTEKADASTAKYGNLYKQRRGLIPEEYLRKDKAVLAEYFSRAAEQIAENTYLGENLSKLDSLLPQIKNIADREYGAQILENMRADGKPVHGIDAAYRGVNSLATFLLSFTSPIQNFFQRGNLLGVKGGNLIDVLESFGSAYTKKGKEFATEAGITTQNTASTIARRAGLEDGGLAAKHHRFILMEATERGNRTAAANLGRKVAQKNFQKVLKHDAPFSAEVLSEMGIDVKAAKARGYLTKEDLASAAFQVVKQTQGLFRKTDLPNLFTKSEGMKLMTKYKSAAHLQTDFMWNVMKEFLRPSNRGKTAINTVLLLAWMEGTGALGQYIKDQMRGKDSEYTPGSGLLSSGLGLAGDVGKTTLHRDGMYLPKTFLGPTVGTAIDVAQGLSSGDGRKILRPFLTHVPFVGSTLTPMLLKKAEKKKKKKK